MFPPVNQVLKAAPAVYALIGDRVYRHGAAVQGAALPYVTWFLVSGDPELNLSENPLVDKCTIQVDCFDPTDSGIEALAKAVRDAIEPHACLVSVPIDDRDSPATKLYRVALQFDWWLNR